MIDSLVILSMIVKLVMKTFFHSSGELLFKIIWLWFYDFGISLRYHFR